MGSSQQEAVDRKVMQGWFHCLTEVRLEADPMKNDGGSSGLCPVLPVSATLDAELAVRTAG